MTKNKSRPVAMLMAGLLWAGLAQAQESTNASGGDAAGIGGTVAYSIGQVVYIANTDASGTVSQGVQQAYEIFTVGIKETELNIFLTVFPNPTTDYLTLEVKEFDLTNLGFQLYDINGKLLQNEKIFDNQTSIDMRNLVPASYFVKVIQENKEIKTFKIIKY